jgi:hypothetical protein
LLFLSFWNFHFKDVQEIVDLCKSLLVYVDGKIEDEKKRLLSIIRSMPVEEVLSLKSSPVLVPNHKLFGEGTACFSWQGNRASCIIKTNQPGWDAATA